MTLQLLYRNATLFLFYLREVDKVCSRVWKTNSILMKKNANHDPDGAGKLAQFLHLLGNR